MHAYTSRDVYSHDMLLKDVMHLLLVCTRKGEEQRTQTCPFCTLKKIKYIHSPGWFPKPKGRGH